MAARFFCASLFEENVVSGARFRQFTLVFALAITGLVTHHAAIATTPTAEHPWRALHVISYTNDAALERFAEGRGARSAGFRAWSHFEVGIRPERPGMLPQHGMFC